MLVIDFLEGENNIVEIDMVQDITGLSISEIKKAYTVIDESVLDDECGFNYCQNCGYGAYDNLICGSCWDCHSSGY